MILKAGFNVLPILETYGDNQAQKSMENTQKHNQPNNANSRKKQKPNQYSSIKIPHTCAHNCGQRYSREQF